MGVIVQELVTRLTELYYANVNYNIGNTKESKKKRERQKKYGINMLNLISKHQ